jgi:small multidrug resistance family-3 protein
VTLRSIALFVVAAVLEIGGAWLVWQAVREGRAWWLAALGVVALGLLSAIMKFPSGRGSAIT